MLFVCDEKYTNCDNYDVQIDCGEEHIFCIYKGEQSNPDEETTLCEACAEKYKDISERVSERERSEK